MNVRSGADLVRLRRMWLRAVVLAGGVAIAARLLAFEPTVLTDVTPAMTLAREETFGPVAPLFRWSSWRSNTYASAVSDEACGSSRTGSWWAGLLPHVAEEKMCRDQQLVRNRREHA